MLCFQETFMVKLEYKIGTDIVGLPSTQILIQSIYTLFKFVQYSLWITKLNIPFATSATYY